MAKRRKRRSPPRQKRPSDLEHAPETDAVRLPPLDEPFRGENQGRLAEREPGALNAPSADASGEGDVTELAQEMDEDAIRHLERNAQKTEPRAVPHPHKKI
jgi:hypothetical protein